MYGYDPLAPHLSKIAASPIEIRKAIGSAVRDIMKENGYLTLSPSVIRRLKSARNEKDLKLIAVDSAKKLAKLKRKQFRMLDHVSTGGREPGYSPRYWIQHYDLSTAYDNLNSISSRALRKLNVPESQIADFERLYNETVKYKTPKLFQAVTNAYLKLKDIL